MGRADRRFEHNDEIDAVVLSAKFGDQMRAAFQNDLAQSQQLTLDQWKSRGVLPRLQEFTAGMWEYWL